MRRSACFVILLCMTSAALAQEALRGAARVIDSDTIEIGNARVRLHGIDAPEPRQECLNKRGNAWPCGRDAATLLSSLIDGRDVECTRSATDNDRYGRMLAVCRAGGLNLNAELVSRGFAWAYREYSTAFEVCEADARQRGVGIWQAQQSQPPWEFRRDAWNAALQVAPGGKPIKGNFNRRRGECIYHTPWSRSYLSTEMGPKNRWFADETEALAAGCRPAQVGVPRHWFKRKAKASPPSEACANP